MDNTISLADPLQCFFTKDIVKFGSLHPMSTNQGSGLLMD